MQIEVTQKNIDEATPGSPCNCPIALALKDINPNCNPRIINGDISFMTNNGKTKYSTPLSYEASRFVCNFDEGQQVRPMQFNILDP